jgi:PEP-CTERM motif
MKALHRLALVAVCFTAISNPAHADSILVGTDLSTASGSSGLCPAIRACQADLQAFTLNSQVTITDVQVVMSHPSFSGLGSDGHFSIGLVAQPIAAGNITFPSNVLVGSGELPYGPGSGDPSQVTLVKGLFDFSGLNITLGPGNYFLEFAGGGVGPAYAAGAVTSSAGTFGQTLACDPTVEQCNQTSAWYALSSAPFAATISGSVVTPEPSSWMLLATGMAGAVGVVRRTYSFRHA